MATPARARPLLESETRIIRTLLCRPHLLEDIPDLETADFDDLMCRLLWVSIMSVADELVNRFAAAVEGVPVSFEKPGSRTEMLIACAEWLTRQHGVVPGCTYDLAAQELMGTRKLVGRQPPVIDPRVLVGDDETPDDVMRKRLKSDAKLIRFSRRARDQMREHLYPTVRS